MKNIRLSFGVLAIGLAVFGCGGKNPESELFSAPKVVPPDSVPLAQGKPEAKPEDTATYTVSRAEINSALTHGLRMKRVMVQAVNLDLDPVGEAERTKTGPGLERQVNELVDFVQLLLEPDLGASTFDITGAQKKMLDALPTLETEVETYYKFLLSHEDEYSDVDY